MRYRIKRFSDNNTTDIVKASAIGAIIGKTVDGIASEVTKSGGKVIRGTKIYKKIPKKALKNLGFGVGLGITGAYLLSKKKKPK